MRFLFSRPVRWLALLLVLARFAFAGFTVPDKQGREAAVGSLSGLSPQMRRVFTNGGEFQAKKEPRGLDWLAQHEEKGQTFPQYLGSRPNVPNSGRNKLYILPIGTFEKDLAPDLESLREYTAAYFHPLQVTMLPAVPDKDVPAESRIKSEKKQWKTGDILTWMKQKLPADGYAMLAVTMTDLYPDDNWNFVFGQASLRDRVGVFSFARYHPSWQGEKPDGSTKTLVLRRAAKVLTHEMGHMFGIQHCIHYQCNMNGANHLDEADATPMELCPVCLRKLHQAIRFDPVERYEKLEKFDEANGLDEEAKWIKGRLEAIKAAK